MRQQKGMSFLGSLFVVAFIIIVGIVVMKMIPVYVRNYEIRDSMRVLNTLSSSLFTDNERMNADVLKTRLMNQLHINEVLDLPDQKIVVTPLGQGHYRVTLHYTERRHLVGSMYLLFIFDETSEVAVGST